MMSATDGCIGCLYGILIDINNSIGRAELSFGIFVLMYFSENLRLKI